MMMSSDRIGFLPSGDERSAYHSPFSQTINMAEQFVQGHIFFLANAVLWSRSTESAHCSNSGVSLNPPPLIKHGRPWLTDSLHSLQIIRKICKNKSSSHRQQALVQSLYVFSKRHFRLLDFCYFYVFRLQCFLQWNHFLLRLLLFRDEMPFTRFQLRNEFWDETVEVAILLLQILQLRLSWGVHRRRRTSVKNDKHFSRNLSENILNETKNFAVSMFYVLYNFFF